MDITISITITVGTTRKSEEAAGYVYRKPTGRAKSDTETDTETNAAANIGKGTGTNEREGTAGADGTGDTTDRQHAIIPHHLRL